MLVFHVVREALESIGRETRRIAPMAAGIVWGVASVFLLGAVGKGFERVQRAVIESLGDSFLLLRMNRPTHGKGDSDVSRRIMLDAEDLWRLRQGVTAGLVSPKAFVWRAQTYYGDEQTWMRPCGVFPEYAGICNVPLEPGGRWLDENDIVKELPVVVIGPSVRQELFGDEPYLGKQVRVSFGGRGGSDDLEPRVKDLTVIGALRDVELSDEFYVSNKSVGFVPYPLFQRMSERGTDFLVLRPHEPERRDEALAQMRALLADRHHFDPDDLNVVLPYYDALDRGAKIDAVFGGIRVFLGAVGLLILLLGAVGVANVVLMSVAARTFEFGLRRALGCRRRWIFLQVFFEAGVVCMASGVLGFLFGLLGVQAMSVLPLPEGFARPVADLGAATVPALLLLGVTLAAAAWPAARAVGQDPVVALRGAAL